jgi:hypothetical protein
MLMLAQAYLRWHAYAALMAEKGRPVRAALGAWCFIVCRASKPRDGRALPVLDIRHGELVAVGRPSSALPSPCLLCAAPILGPSRTVGDAAAAYPPIAAVRGGRRQRQSWAKT